MELNAGQSLSQEARPARKRNRKVLACTECHGRKQKCNRSLPCDGCIFREVPHKCKYEKIDVQSRMQNTSRPRKAISSVTIVHEFTAESIAALATADALSLSRGRRPSIINRQQSSVPNQTLLHELGASIIFLNNEPFLQTPSLDGQLTLIDVPLKGLDSLDPFSTLPQIACWAQTMQKPLIHYFLQTLAPWLSEYEEGLTPTCPKLSWLPEAIQHPTLYHATMLGAAVHLQRRQPTFNPRIALWFKTETLRLLNESLATSVEGVSDQIILAAMILLHYNVGGGDPIEYEVHLRGIHQMLKLRGGIGDHLGPRGIVKNWLAVCHGPWDEGWERSNFIIKQSYGL